MKRNLIVIGLTVLVILMAALLAVNLHRTSEEEVVFQFQEHQLLHAQHVASQIESYFESRTLGLRALSSFISVQYGEPKRRKTDIQAYFQQLKRVYVKTISVYDETGKIVDSTDDQFIGRSFRRSDFISWARKEKNKGKIFISPSPQNHSLRVLLAIPLYQEASDVSHPEPTGKFVGVLSLAVDLKEYIAGHFDKISKQNPHQLWIVDKDGTPVFHSVCEEPDGKEECRNIYQRTQSCSHCHASFEYVENILKEKRGTLTYQLKNSPRKLAAFAPMEFENVSWVVVVNAAYDEMTAFARKSLWGHLLLLGFIVFSLIAGSVLLNRNYQMKVKAAEELKRWHDRQRAEETLQRERNKLKGILHSMADGVYIVNQQHNIEYINPVLEKEFGPIQGRKCYEYFHERTETCPWCKNQEVFAGKSVQWEWYSPKTGKTYDLFDTPVLTENGTISKLEIFHDITQRKRAEKEQQKSEEQFRMLVETMNEGLGVKNENGLWTYANDKLCYLLGRFQAELVGRPVIEFLDETNRTIFKEQMGRRGAGKADSYEIIWTNTNGRKIPTIVSPKPIFDKAGRFKGSIAVITDISEQKTVEEILRESEKRLHYLSSQLLTIQDQERKRISAELHDELGQALAVMKLRINLIQKALRKDQGETREDCKKTLQYIDQVIENVRRLSRDLSPSILENLGFSAALRWLINNFSKNDDMKISLDVADIDHLFSQKTHINLYRIFQEALTNIGKHAQATRVSIAIKKDGDRVSFSVEDDGKGFDVRQATLREVTEKGLGLETMNERVWMLGGSLDLRSQEGKGTRLSFAIPI